MTTSRAAVLVKPETFELWDIPIPETGGNDALLRLEVCGMCGTDYELYYGHIQMAAGYPFIPGHEPVGIIERIGPQASTRWGVKAGDRVALGATHGIGLPGSSRPVVLRGGYSQYMYVAPETRVFPVSKALPVEAVATYKALAAGVYWGVLLPELRLGQSIVILGPGQRGLAALIAARAAGAAFIAITGLARDAYKLELARDLGADLAIDVEKDDAVAAVSRALPQGADVVLDTTPPSKDPYRYAAHMLRPGGTLVLAGGNRGLDVDALYRKRSATVRIAPSPSDEAVAAALKLIESGKYPYQRLVTHRFPLEKASEAIQTLAGKYPDRKAINVILVPPG